MKTLTSLGLKFEKGRLLILDQTRLPQEEVWIDCESPDHMVEIIKALKVRGAPLIGVSAALALAHHAEKGESAEELRAACKRLRDARPTAVNLMSALDRMKGDDSKNAWQKDRLVALATEIFEEDVRLCEGMARHGSPLIADGDGVLTHCNTGGLATAGSGTALAVMKRAHDEGKRIHVYVDETRPLLQGGRLTTWELERHGIPYTLICDNMAAILMREKKIQKVFVGSDRIAANGDFANKVGTYTVAVTAHHHSVSFYAVAPRTTVDLKCPTGAHIPIEEREAQEVRGVNGAFGRVTWSPAAAPVFNPSFDVTPVDLVTGIVLDSGVFVRSELQKGVLERNLR